MINLNLYNHLRIIDETVMRHYGTVGDGTCGAFRLPSPIDGATLTIIASSDDDWDHVSVSRKNRVPNQVEMDHVYRLFFAADETAVQFFVPQDEHVNNMQTCLHLWRPRRQALPKPPQDFV